MSIWDDEAARARLYRANTAACVRYGLAQLRRLAPPRAQQQELLESEEAIRRRDNFLPGQPGSGDFSSPYDYDYDDTRSRSSIELPGARHAGDQGGA